MFAGKKSAQIREILISESAWEEMTCLFAPSLRPRDYDLLYFLFADAVQPFVDAIHAGYTEGNPVFDKIMKRVEDHLNTNAKAG